MNQKYILLFLFSLALNNDFSINTSRPGSYNPTSVVNMNIHQIELGLNQNSDDRYMWMFYRYGIHGNGELQMTFSPDNFIFGYMYGNIKYANNLEGSIIVSVENDLPQKISDTNLYFPISYSINNSLTFNAQLGIHSDSDSQYSYAIALSKSFKQKYSVFLEFYGNTNSAILDNYFDFGFTYLTSGNMQFDISAGVFITETKILEKYFLELGFSFYL
ncbi:MAG: hypothetical protein CMG64_03435 [Candidatus Marinimicrobia bacterium]|nr:hypothetical protein [Candidatus Neomarinimicrobiota bacterium]